MAAWNGKDIHLYTGAIRQQQQIWKSKRKRNISMLMSQNTHTIHKTSMRKLQYFLDTETKFYSAWTEKVQKNLATEIFQ